MSIIYIFWLRQIKRYFRSKPRVIGSLFQPIFFLVALGFGLGPIYSQATGESYIQFLAPGIIAMSILFTSIFSGIDLIWDKKSGFIKEVLVAPVPRIMIMFGRTLGSATIAFLQGVIILLLTLLVGFRPEISFLFPLAFLFMALVALVFTSFGIAIASLLEDMTAFPLVMNFLVMPIFFLSGAIFPLENLPPAIQWFSYLNPLSYGVDGIRGALVSQTFGSLNILVLVFSFSVVLTIETWLFRKIQV